MVTISSISQEPGRLYAFYSSGKLCSGDELISRRGLLATKWPGTHGALFLSKSGDAMAFEAYQDGSLDTPFAIIFEQRPIKDDSPEAARQLIAKLLKAPAKNRGPLGLLRYLNRAEAIEPEMESV